MQAEAPQSASAEGAGNQVDDENGSNDSAAEKPTGKQLLAWVTGDRDREAKALAEQTAKVTDFTVEEALPAAKVAVGDAHGDSGIAAADDDRSLVAKPSDVAKAIEDSENENQ
jgi:hypothetical protein